MSFHFSHGQFHTTVWPFDNPHVVSVESPPLPHMLGSPHLEVISCSVHCRIAKGSCQNQDFLMNPTRNEMEYSETSLQFLVSWNRHQRQPSESFFLFLLPGKDLRQHVLNSTEKTAERFTINGEQLGPPLGVLQGGQKIIGIPTRPRWQAEIQTTRYGHWLVQENADGRWAKQLYNIRGTYLENEATFFKPKLEWVVAPLNVNPDSGASVHVMSNTDLQPEELETVRVPRRPTIVIMANGRSTQSRRSESTWKMCTCSSRSSSLRTPAAISLWTEHPHTSHFLALSCTHFNVARDIGSSLVARALHLMCHLHVVCYSILYDSPFCFPSSLSSSFSFSCSYEPKFIDNYHISETIDKIIQESSSGGKPLNLHDLEFDDYTIGRALSPPLFQEREDPASRRQVYHSPDESLLSNQSSSVGHVRTGRPVADEFDSLISNVRENPRRDSESEQIRILLERQKEQILADYRAEIQKIRVPGRLWQKKYPKVEWRCRISTTRNLSCSSRRRTTSTRSTTSSWTIIGTKSGSSWRSWEKSQWDGKIEAISRLYIRYNVTKKIDRRSRHYPWTHR